MPERQAHAEVANVPGSSGIALPAGTPGWVTPELVALTLRVWQPKYPLPLSVDDAIAMLIDTGRLVSLLCQRGPRGESGCDSRPVL